MARVLVVLAEGFEEIETATVVDVLRRAELEVVLAGLDGCTTCTGSRQMRFVPDLALAEAQGDWDLVVLPGGLGGTQRMLESTALRQMLRVRAQSQQAIAAICAAPLVLQRAGVLGERFTCHPSVAQRLPSTGWQDQSVVDDGLVITSRSAGTAMHFALHLVERLCGEAKRREVELGLAI